MTKASKYTRNWSAIQMKSYKIIKIAISVILLVTLLTGMVPAAWAESSFQAVVTSDSMKVYSQSKPYTYLGSLSRGTEVTVLAYANGAALISYNGNTGIAKVSDMQKVTAEAPAASAPSAQQYNSKPVIAVRNTRIYSRPSTSGRYVSVAAGTSMNLLAVNGSAAMVEKGGVVGYAVVSHLGEPGSVIVPEVTQAPAATQAPAIDTSMKVAVVANRSTRIYQKPSTASRYVSIPAGTSMNVVAVNGNAAMVERNGVYGYAVKSHLSAHTADAPVQPAPAVTPAPAPVVTPAPTANTGALENSINNSSTSTLFNSNYSNEEIVVRFLVKELGYTVAAACGVAGNIKYESGFKPTSSGDSGTSYGICQWHAGRKTRLINWCNDNGYDYKTLEGQLFYLKQELTKYYTKVHKYLLTCENSAQGAYDAGYYFCYHFEAPANRSSKSVTRGNYAKNTVWPRYS